MTRGLFRLWLVASLIWVIMLLPGLWGGTPSPFPAFTSADNVWFETTHHSFDTTNYVYTPDGEPKPRGTHNDLAWGDEEYDHKIGTDETIKFHKLSSEPGTPYWLVFSVYDVKNRIRVAPLSEDWARLKQGITHYRTRANLSP